ncbi:protease HtpX [Candidatus Gracilibacteria bacterium]|nr:protease HtpX [Candidatus Gracilibacteria bacterium]
MGILKRFGLFALTNIAVILLFSIILFAIERIFGIDIGAASGQSYMGLLIYAALFGFIGAFFSLSISRWSAKKAYGIVPFSEEEVHKLNGKEKLVYETVREIAVNHGINTPEVGIYQATDPNAFATGPSKNKSLVAVSTGLLGHMNEQEIEGVVAHEMAHVLNGDMVTMTLLQGVMNTFVIFFARIAAEFINSRTDGKLGNWGYLGVYLLLQIVLGVLASLVVNAFSRHREFKADEGSSRYVGKEKMIAALKSLQNMKSMQPNNVGKMATMQINTQTDGGVKRFFMTHPALEKRIENLEKSHIL